MTRWGRWLVATSVAFSLLTSASLAGAAEETFVYAAYVGGAKAGEARVVVSRVEDRYAVRGKAKSVGWLELLSGWRAHFWAAGRVVDGEPVADAYEVVERNWIRVREVHAAGGRFVEVANGRARAPRNVPSGLDLLSALFLSSRYADVCVANTRLHTGRRGYLLELLSTRPGALTNSRHSSYAGPALQCEYHVSRDQEELHAVVWLAEVNGVRVPVRARFAGAVDAGIYLI